MPADATTLLGLVVSAVETLYPEIPVRQLKKSLASGKYPDGDRPPPLPTPCFVVTSGEEESPNDAQSFEHLTTRYWVLVEYVKAAFAAVPSGDPNPPAAEDSDVRDKREAVRLRFDRPTLAGLGNCLGVRVRPRRPFEYAASDKRVVVSGWAFGFDLWTARP